MHSLHDKPVGAASRGDYAQHERHITKESRVTPKSRVTPGLTRGPCIVANPKERKWIPGQAWNDGGR